MPSGAAAASCLHDRLVAIVERGVEAELVAQQRDFLGGAGAANHGAAALLGDLAGDAADGAGRARDEHDVARLDLGELEPDPRRMPGHAEHAEIARERR